MSKLKLELPCTIGNMGIISFLVLLPTMCSGARGRRKSNTWWRSKKKKFSDGRWESCLYGIYEENKGGWCFLYQKYVFKVRNRETNNDQGGGWRQFGRRASNGWIPPPPIQPNNDQAHARSRSFQTPPVHQTRSSAVIRNPPENPAYLPNVPRLVWETSLKDW